MMTKVEAYDEAVRRWGDAAGVVELGPGRCLVGRWELATTIGELVGPYVLATSRHVFRVLGEGATFAAALDALPVEVGGVVQWVEPARAAE